MSEINDIIKNMNNNINTNESYDRVTPELSSKWFNETDGELNLEDGIECPKCKNKGKISFVKDNREYIKDCECMKARKTYFRLMACGITKETLKKYSFQNWIANEGWQNALLEKCKNFFREYLNKNKYWFILSGQSGCGKTHICTSLFQEMIKGLFLNGFYMRWNDEIPKLLSLRKSTYTDNQEKYEKIINQYKECDILYIDDLFKLDNRYREESLSICYEILNHRYINQKTTIISTEVEQDQFENIDTAIWGRCVEMTNRNEYWITLTGKNKNYRTKEIER